MLKSFVTCLSVLTLTLSPSIAWAHEGHGHSPDQGHTAWHYLTEPLHLLQLVAAVTLIVVLSGLAARFYLARTNAGTVKL